MDAESSSVLLLFPPATPTYLTLMAFSEVYFQFLPLHDVPDVISMQGKFMWHIMFSVSLSGVSIGLGGCAFITALRSGQLQALSASYMHSG